MDRLAARHEVTRAELFRHLDCEPWLASRDLARGWPGVAAADYAAFHQLIETLAWAVQAPTRAIAATFIPAPESALLPPALRVFGCALCWRDAVIAGEPMVLERDWILRASWRCQRHNLPLAPVRRLIGDRAPRSAVRILEAQVVALDRLRRRLPPTAAMAAFNHNVLGQLMGQQNRGMRRGETAYRTRFVANRFHLAPTRIALLAAAHSARPQAPDRFERLVALSAPALLRSSANLLDPKGRRPDAPAPWSVPEGLITRRVVRWEAGLADLIGAYALVLRARMPTAPGMGRPREPQRAISPDFALRIA
ncbi:hypothetical protein [Novosphingobium olei]|uniref:TniQ protein n=1 Tax=Novosphingobium olei TaxID=2728851 RepID=A0A7Y0GAJ4_9SPHN|nr:hypothetical protein [Novosphingobium olei]NML95135.1 hypothetical protein [Novosphingobium olei]